LTLHSWFDHSEMGESQARTSDSHPHRAARRSVIALAAVVVAIAIYGAPFGVMRLWPSLLHHHRIAAIYDRLYFPLRWLIATRPSGVRWPAMTGSLEVVLTDYDVTGGSSIQIQYQYHESVPGTIVEDTDGTVLETIPATVSASAPIKDSHDLAFWRSRLEPLRGGPVVLTLGAPHLQTNLRDDRHGHVSVEETMYCQIVDVQATGSADPAAHAQSP
jgi:hypothetical protein